MPIILAILLAYHCSKLWTGCRDRGMMHLARLPIKMILSFGLSHTRCHRCKSKIKTRLIYSYKRTTDH